MHKLLIDNLEIEIQRKKIKYLHLYVLPPDGSVRITAPKMMSEAAIRDFVVSRVQWIRKHQESIAKRPKQPQLNYVTGEMVSLWGREYCLEVIEDGKRSSIRIDGNKLLLRAPVTSNVEQRSKLINEWYRHNLKTEIPSLLEKWEEIMGVKALDWGIKNMKTRWGTCNIKARRIWLNLRLAQKEPECLEYVVVHELAHLLEKHHNKVFKDHMSHFLPGWKATKAQLNGMIRG